MREETIRLSQLSLTRSYRQISDCGEFTLVSVNGRSAYSDVHSVVPVPLIALDDHPPGHFFGIYPHGNGAWRQCTGCGDNRGAGRARRTTIGPLTPLGPTVPLESTPRSGARHFYTIAIVVIAIVVATTTAAVCTVLTGGVSGKMLAVQPTQQGSTGGMGPRPWSLLLSVVGAARTDT